MNKRLAILANDALSNGNFSTLGEALANQTHPESFGILVDPILSGNLTALLGSGDPADWIMRPLTWNSTLYAPDAVFTPPEQLLHLLWQDLQSRLVRKLEAVNRRAALASRGAVLCSFGRAELSFAVEYQKTFSGAITLRPLAVRPAPTAVLDLSAMLHEVAPAISNAIKAAAFSVDKLIYHRGAITHVHRQQEEEVFGPTIDTLLLAELSAEWLEEQSKARMITALEVGPGSGLLSTIIATSEAVAELTSIDLNGVAAFCTVKNLRINEIMLDAVHQTVRVRAERFSIEQIANSFDFVVCNPPYIPEPPGVVDTADREYGRAVGGLDLCREILISLPRLLNKEGRLLMMTSSLSDAEVLQLVPEGFQVISALAGMGRRVPLDVDLVWRNQNWQNQLSATNRIEADARGALWHYLRPTWIINRAGKP